MLVVGPVHNFGCLSLQQPGEEMASGSVFRVCSVLCVAAVVSGVAISRLPFGEVALEKPKAGLAVRVSFKKYTFVGSKTNFR